MPITAITATDIIRRYADDIAYVAERDPASDLDEFIDQLDTVVRNLGLAGIHGHEDLEVAGTLLDEARNSSEDAVRGVFLGRAAELLDDLPDMVDEYRGMVGD